MGGCSCFVSAHLDGATVVWVLQVAKVMEAARGGVLFIDEAYALGSGSYGEEAITKLLGMLTGTPAHMTPMRAATSFMFLPLSRCMLPREPDFSPPVKPTKMHGGA